MIIAFCGHSKYVSRLGDEKKIIDILEKTVGDTPCEFFLGEYGDFDHFAYHCSKKFKQVHPNVKLVFVTPYITESYEKNSSGFQKGKFDLIIYPGLERVPPKYAISHRNRWIAEQADIIISYISHEYGGAYAMYQHAKRKGKEVYNIAL